jgi:hypothetical protein
MAKKFPKSANPKVKATASAKTRRHLFEVIHRSIEQLDDRCSSADVEKVPTEVLMLIAAVSGLWSDHVKTLIDIAAAEAEKKTPRPKARRKG